MKKIATIIFVFISVCVVSNLVSENVGAENVCKYNLIPLRAEENEEVVVSGINDSGEIVGYVVTPTNGGIYPFHYFNYQIKEIDVLEGNMGQILGINNRGILLEHILIATMVLNCLLFA